ncbi:MAG: lipopolysaccharide biosynthesis protein [Geminicoccaceae bacterium]
MAASGLSAQASTRFWREERFRTTALLGGARALSAILSFVAMTVAARSVGAAGLGAYAFAIGVQAYVAHISEFGLRPAVTAAVAARPDQRSTLAKAYVLTRLALAVPAIFLALAVLAAAAPDRLTLNALVMPSVIGIALLTDWLLIIDGRFASAGAVQVARPGVYLLLIAAIATQNDLQATHLAVAFSLSWLIVALWCWWLARPGLRLRETEWRLQVPALFRAGKPLLAVTLLSQALLTLDLLVVATVLDDVSAGRYALASGIIGAGLVFAHAFQQTALPRYARAFALGETPPLGADIALISCLALGGAIACLSLSPWMVPLVFGAEFEPAIAILIGLLPTFAIYHVNAVLIARATADTKRRHLVRAHLWAVAALGIGLLVFAFWELLAIAVAARFIGELSRFVGLLGSLKPDERAQTVRAAWPSLAAVLVSGAWLAW